MSDGNKLLSKMDCKYGAPMGRITITDKTDGKVQLFRVNLTEGYDTGGAYWGSGPPSLYCAMGEDFQVFCRASNRETAKKKMLADFPNLKFFR